MATGATVLLVNPPWITRDDNVWHAIKGAMPPLSLLSIGAVLELHGFKPVMLDAHVEAMSEEQVEEAIRKAKPQYIGLTMMTNTAIVSHQIARIAKKVDPSIIVVAGGVHADAMPEETLRNAAIDLVVRGDGEFAMLEICQGKPLREILGLCWRQDGKPVRNPSRPPLMDLNKLPRYAYHLAPMDRYYPSIGAYRRLPAINMLMTRGCPGKCIFCNSAETALRTRSAEHVVDEIIHLRDTYGIRELQFYDDTFTVMKQNVLKFCRLMKEKKVGVTFSCFARADCINEETAKALYEAGCHQVMFGVESGSQRILKILRKDIDLERTKAAVRLTQAAGIEVRAAFVFGTPGETEETIQETLDYAIELDPDIAIFNITTPYPGTQLYAWAEERKLIVSADWWDYELGGAILDLPLKGEKIRGMYDKAFKAFYNRPKMYWRRFKRIRSFRLLKDTIEAFLYIMLRVKVGRRGEYRLEWLKHKREEYFDFEFTQGLSETEKAWSANLSRNLAGSEEELRRRIPAAASSASSASAI